MNCPKRFNTKIWLVTLVAGVLLSGCGPSDEDRSSGSALSEPVIVFGVDGAEWDVIDGMIENGDLPNFARMRDEGAWGHLLNPGPQVSPVVWTTFATGHFGREHGILDFVYPFNEQAGKRPVDSTLRIEPAIWNLATRHDLESTVIGYFVSYPAEQINGKMITDRAFSGVEGSHWPEKLAERSAQIKRQVLAELEPVRKRFIPWDYAPEQAKDRNNPYYTSARMVQGRLDNRIPVEEFLRRITIRELDDVGDLFVTYSRIVDYVGHSLWFYHDWSDYENKPNDQDKRLLGGAIEESYRYVDEILGEILDRYAEQANILLISDHGFGSATGNFQVARGRRDLLTGNHRPDGVLIAHGPAFRPGRIEGGTVMGIMPTLAALLGLPISDELPGSIFQDLLTDEFLDRMPPTYTPGYGDLADAGEQLEIDRSVELQEMEELRGLGYVDDGVQFSAGNGDRSYDFWGSSPNIIAFHLVGEVTYALIRGDAQAADAVMREVEQHSPELKRRIIAGVDTKIDFFRDDVPGLDNLAPGKDEFVAKYRNR